LPSLPCAAELTGYNNPIVDKELRKWMKTARAEA